MRFENLGIPVRDAGLFNYTVGPDESGRHNTVYLSFFQEQAPWFVVGVNVETGATLKYQGQTDHGCWSIVTAPDGCIYTGTCSKVGSLNRIDPKTAKITYFGPAIKGETYVWSLVVGEDGCIYGGTYPSAKLFRFDPTTERVEDLGRMDPREQYNRYLVAVGDLIYCAIGTVRPKVVAYDVKRRTQHDIDLPGLDTSGTPSFTKTADGELYCHLSADRYDGRTYRYRLDGLEALPVDEVPERGLVAVADGRKVVSVRETEIILRTPKGEQQSLSYEYSGDGARVFVLRNGPDGKLYGSTALPLRLFQVDPESGRMINLGNPTRTSGEIYSLLAFGSRLYMCAYPRATLTMYEADKPWQPEATPTDEGGQTAAANPRHIGFLGEGQDRPPTMIDGGDGTIYIGTIPTYGELGGALVRLDPTTHEWKVNRHVEPNQCVVSLASDPETGRVYGGTSIQGGGGTTPVTKSAVLFAWDTEEQTKVGTWQPFADARAITSLARVDRRLFGLTSDGRLFIFDLDEKKLVQECQPNLGPAHMEALLPSGDGDLLTLLGDHVVRIDPQTCKVSVIGNCPGITAGFAATEKAVYFASTAEIIRGLF